MSKSEKPFYVFNVMGKSCPVFLKSGLLELYEKLAYFDRDSGEMFVDESLAGDPEKLFDTLMHEVWHAVCRRSGLYQANEAGVEEVQCEMFATAVREIVMPFVNSLDLSEKKRG